MTATPPIDLDDLKVFLAIPSSNSTLDAQLTSVLATATEQVESVVGPMVARSKTDAIRDVAWDGSFMLKTFPVVSVTSITNHATSTALDLSTLDIDLDVGKVSGAPFAARYDVVATVGRSEIPESLKEITRELGEHIWTARRAPDALARPSMGGDSQVVNYRGFMWPNRLLEMVRPYELLWAG